jgi:simple sugar transport system ATP-binding protein
MRRITKIFPGVHRFVRANQGVDLTVGEGEVHAIVGENGAGKSTLMNILYGLLPPDEGEIEIFGRPTAIKHPEQAIELGIGMIHQHFMLVPSFTVGENIVLGEEPNRAGLLDRRRIRRLVQSLSDRMGLTVDPDVAVRDTPVGVQQRVEILKALYRGARILILDEPTAVLTPQEVHDLFEALRKMADEGKSVILITHKLDEVLSLADRVTVMRDGAVVGRADRADLDERRLAQMITGHAVAGEASEARRPRASLDSEAPMEPVLEVKDLWRRDERGLTTLGGVSFRLFPGEILGIAGVAQNGQETLAEVLTGERAATAGTVRLDGRDITNLTVRQIRDLGMGHIPDDRYQDGCARTVTVSRNLIMGAHHRPPVGGPLLLNRQYTNEWADELIRDYEIAVEHHDMPMASLSGGNVQKAIVAREMRLARRCLIAEEPSRGVDIGACEFIYHRMRALRDRSVGILLVSSDLTEILRLSDRIVVMFNGRIVGERRPEETTPEDLGVLMTGMAS